HARRGHGFGGHDGQPPSGDAVDPARGDRLGGAGADAHRLGSVGPVGRAGRRRGEGVPVTKGPTLRAAVRPLGPAKTQGFSFERIAPGDDGPILGRRESLEYKDEIYIGGFSDSCHATRARKSSLIIPRELAITARVNGDALTVLHTVVTEWNPT